MLPSEKLTLDNFRQILEKAYDQVAKGKGKARHGIDKEFYEQPWRVIAEHVGTEFLIGQAIKKLMELKTHKIAQSSSDSVKQLEEHKKRWHTDALGAIVYIVMTVMYEEYKDMKDIDKTNFFSMLEAVQE